MSRLLVINPNTGQASTARLAAFVPRALPSGCEATFVTARFGAPYIACEASYAVAGHAVLDAWSAALHASGQFDRVLIGCFGDPGLHALRESAACSVTGLAEASFIEASALGPFAIVTGGERWKPMLERLALTLGFAPHLQHIETVKESGAELLADPTRAVEILGSACKRAARSNVKSIILGGAGLAGFAAQVESGLELPVIDSVLAGARVAMGDGLPAPARTTPAFFVQWTNLAPEMNALH
jgi:allantoin racemase